MSRPRPVLPPDRPLTLTVRSKAKGMRPCSPAVDGLVHGQQDQVQVLQHRLLLDGPPLQGRALFMKAVYTEASERDYTNQGKPLGRT